MAKGGMDEERNLAAAAWREAGITKIRRVTRK
jgi:hypothetical protein